jgi:hypothetical protein
MVRWRVLDFWLQVTVEVAAVLLEVEKGLVVTWGSMMMGWD